MNINPNYFSQSLSKRCEELETKANSKPYVSRLQFLSFALYTLFTKCVIPFHSIYSNCSNIRAINKELKETMGNEVELKIQRKMYVISLCKNIGRSALVVIPLYPLICAIQKAINVIFNPLKAARINHPASIQLLDELDFFWQKESQKIADQSEKTLSEKRIEQNQLQKDVQTIKKHLDNLTINEMKEIHYSWDNIEMVFSRIKNKDALLNLECSIQEQDFARSKIIECDINNSIFEVDYSSDEGKKTGEKLYQFFSSERDFFYKNALYVLYKNCIESDLLQKTEKECIEKILNGESVSFEENFLYNRLIMKIDELQTTNAFPIYITVTQYIKLHIEKNKKLYINKSFEDFIIPKINFLTELHVLFSSNNNISEKMQTQILRDVLQESWVKPNISGYAYIQNMLAAQYKDLKQYLSECLKKMNEKELSFPFFEKDLTSILNKIDFRKEIKIDEYKKLFNKKWDVYNEQNKEYWSLCGSFRDDKTLPFIEEASLTELINNCKNRHHISEQARIAATELFMNIQGIKYQRKFPTKIIFSLECHRHLHLQNESKDEDRNKVNIYYDQLIKIAIKIAKNNQLMSYDDIFKQTYARYKMRIDTINLLDTALTKANYSEIVINKIKNKILKDTYRNKIEQSILDDIMNYVSGNRNTKCLYSSKQIETMLDQEQERYNNKENQFPNQLRTS